MRQRSYSVEFKLQLVREYLAGEGGLKGIADRYHLNHSVIVYWLKKYHQACGPRDARRASRAHPGPSVYCHDTLCRRRAGVS